jgi:predicted RND superfamily exporter protein
MPKSNRDPHTALARQQKTGPAILVALLTIGTGVAVLILGCGWFVFLRT